MFFKIHIYVKAENPLKLSLKHRLKTLYLSRAGKKRFYFQKGIFLLSERYKIKLFFGVQHL